MFNFRNKKPKERIGLDDLPCDLMLAICSQMKKFDRWGLDSLTTETEGEAKAATKKNRFFTHVLESRHESCFGDFVCGNVFIRYSKTEYLRLWYEC